MVKAVGLGSFWTHSVHGLLGEDSTASGQDELSTVVMASHMSPASQHQGTISESSLCEAVPIAGTCCQGLGSYYGCKKLSSGFPPRHGLARCAFL